MTTETIGAYGAKTHFSELLDRVRQGAVFVVTKNGKPVAQLGPVETLASGRVFGSAKGRVRMRNDFDAPLADFTAYEA